MGVSKREIIAKAGLVSGTNLRYIISAGLHGDDAVQYVSFDRETGALYSSIPSVCGYKRAIHWAERLATPEEISRLDMAAMQQMISSVVARAKSLFETRLTAEELGSLMWDIENFYHGRHVSDPSVSKLLVTLGKRKKIEVSSVTTGNL